MICYKKNNERIAGVDEAGRGALAGSVFSAAVILDSASPIDGLADSKLLSPPKREALAIRIKKQALAYSIQEAYVSEIEEMNILHASLLAMYRAVASLSIAPDQVWIDGNQKPKQLPYAKTIVKGDSLVAEISAASILAKVERDHSMRLADLLYPAYGFANHKGYPTKKHIVMLQRFGVSPIHRKTFAPVAKNLSP